MNPANMRRRLNVVLLVAHRLRHWPKSKPTLGQRLTYMLGTVTCTSLHTIVRAEALVQWLKLPAWKVGDRRFESHSGLQVSKKQNVSSPLTRIDAILWGGSVTEGYRVRRETARARISNPLSGGQCTFISPYKRFSWLSV